MSCNAASRKVSKKMSVIDFKDAQRKLLEQSDSNSQSTQNTASGGIGLLPTDEPTLEVIIAIYQLLTLARAKPFTTKSDTARAGADIVALCACEGLLTTMLPEGTFTNVWMVTSDGITWLEGATDALAPRQ